MHGTLPTPSEEQRRVIEKLLEGRNVVCSAAAGSGKTTMQLLAVQALDRQAVIITYNKELRDDVDRRITELGLQGRVQVYTFHALFRAQTNRSIQNDEELVDALNDWRREVSLPRRLDVDFVCLDEVQDMCELYHTCLWYVMPERCVRMLVVGDGRQMLYDWKFNELKADKRYLADAQAAFDEYTEGEWERCMLSVSYRLTPNMATFVNKVWGTSITGGNAGCNEPVEYWHVGNMHEIVRRFRVLLDIHHAEDILVLFQSTTESYQWRPYTMLSNMLQEIKDESGRRVVNIHMKGRKCTHAGENVLKNKLRIWSYCGCKGIEAPVVVVFGFSVYDTKRVKSLIDQMGVALSRASSRLIVVHEKSAKPRGYWPGLNMQALRELIDAGVVKLHERDLLPPDAAPGFKVSDKPIVPSDLGLSPQSLVRLLTPFAWQHDTLADPRSVQASTQAMFLTGATRTTEDFGNLLGLAIPFALEYRRTGVIGAVERLINKILVSSNHLYSRDKFEDILRRYRIREVQDLLDNLYSESYMSGKELLDKLERKELVNAEGRTMALCDECNFDMHFKDESIERVHTVYSNATTGAHYVYLANAASAFCGKHSQWHQIGQDVETYRDWVNEKVFWNAYNNLDRMTTACRFEVRVSRPLTRPIEKGVVRYVDYHGRVDGVDGEGGTVYEYKWSSDITNADRAQLLLGAALYALETDRDVAVKLCNYRTGVTEATRLTKGDARDLLAEVERAYDTQ